MIRAVEDLHAKIGVRAACQTLGPYSESKF
jgi:hypothetical protein